MPGSPASGSISTISALRAALKLAALMLGLAARYDSWMVRISVIFMAGPLAGGPEGRPRAYPHLTVCTGRGQAGRTWRLTAVNAPSTGVAIQAIWKRRGSFGLQPSLLLKRLQACAWRGKPTASTVAGTEAHRQF